MENTDLKALRHKQFFNNFICNNADQSLVPEDILPYQLQLNQNSRQAASGSGPAASSAAEPDGFPKVKVDRVLMAGGTDELYLDEEWMVRVVIPEKLYEVRKVDSDERVHVHK